MRGTEWVWTAKMNIVTGAFLKNRHATHRPRARIGGIKTIVTGDNDDLQWDMGHRREKGKSIVELWQ